MSTGIDRRSFLKTAAIGVGAGVALAKGTKALGADAKPSKSVFGLKAKPMEVVRIGMIGVGSRGGSHLRTYLRLEGCEIKAICDNYEPHAIGAQNRVVKAGHPKPEIYTKGDYDYRRMLERDDLDLVVIATPWHWHVPMAVDAMLAGKHAAVEVPAAVTIEGCWKLVDTAEKTQKNCMMMENCCYGRDELMALNMARKGIFGDLLYGEGGYIHHLTHFMGAKKHSSEWWRPPYHAKYAGNLYPTHGLGPIAQYMSINRGDKFDYLTSMGSAALGRAEYAREHLPADNPYNQMKFISGDMNVSLIKTAKGRMIAVKHDTTTPQPYDRINLIQGTHGVFRGYPSRVHIEGRGGRGWHDMGKCRADFEHPLWKRMGTEAKKAGGHGGMDFLMNWRLIYCLRNGEALDQDVYDAASWSAVGPVSDESVRNRSNSIDMPDFTRGAWKTNKALGIIT
jgi:predicted dehydrogenase